MRFTSGKSIAGAFLGLLLIILLVFPVEVLILRDHQTKQVLMTLPLSSDKHFTVKWIHSVELEPWEEIFYVDHDMNIVLESTRFKAFGAGVPDSAGKRVETKDGYTSFLEINKPMPYLSYGISPIAKHTLIIGSKTYPLHKILPDDTGVKFETDKVPMVYILFKHILSSSGVLSSSGLQSNKGI